MKKIVNVKNEYFKLLDVKAKHIAKLLSANKKVSLLLMQSIQGLYKSASTEKDFTDSAFKSAYQQSITSELEFLIARVLYNYSKINNLDWTIYLRTQKKNKESGKLVVPDIKIEKNEKVVAIIEIKAKAGWMQSFFFKEIKSKKDKDSIEKNRSQLLKYASIPGSSGNKVFVFLPTFIHVSRRKHEKIGVQQYRDAFAKNSTLRKSNLILLSSNPFLNLADLNENKKNNQFSPTDDFEKFIKALS